MCSMTSDALTAGVCDATLPKAAWTHAAHVATGYTLVTRLGADDALTELRRAIPRLNDAHGTPNNDHDGYHDTLTVYFTAAIADCVRRGLDLETTTATLGTTAPLAHWSRERLFSVLARRGWVEPDLAALPFPVPAGALASRTPIA